MFSSCNPKFFAVRHIHYPVNLSSDHFHTDAVVPSGGHCLNGQYCHLVIITVLTMWRHLVIITASIQ